MRLITIKDTKAAKAELNLSPKQSHRVGDSWFALYGIGENLCWANSPWKGNPPLTTKSLSASTV